MLQNLYLLDGSNKILGRLSCTVCNLLCGKSDYSCLPYDRGIHVIVINAQKIKFTGKKLFKKIYYNHSGYPGGLRERRAFEILKKFPERILFYSIKGMLPKNCIGRAALTRLRIYPSSIHLHSAQKPVFLAS